MDLRIEIAGDRVLCKQNGRQVLSAPLQDFLRHLAQQSDEPAVPEPIPEGVRYVRRRGAATALVMEEKPQLRVVSWLAEHSPRAYGPKAAYRKARLAFPYVVIIVVLQDGALTGYQQCFYRTAPLSRLTDPLFYPNLPNVAEGYKQDCWLCLANLRQDMSRLSLEAKVQQIRTHFWAASFNRSSEEHEGMSYWQAMRTMNLDPRLQNLIAWEQASKEEPLFPLSVAWKPVGKTVAGVVEEMLSAVAPAPCAPTVQGLVHLLSLCAGNKPPA